MNLTITAYSTALFSTWYFIEELGLLFDAGDGLMAGILQKSRKINHAFISHADRDHLGGLLQFNQLNAREGAPVIYYPKDCGSFPKLAEFFGNFDPHMAGTVWKGIEKDQVFSIKKNVIVESLRNGHVECPPDWNKSLSYCVFETKQKLKSEFQTWDKNELKNLIFEKGKEFVTEEIKTPIINYSGDTPVEDFDRWKTGNILIHEATFLEPQAKSPARANKHSTLEEVMEMVSYSSINTLVLGHFSSRYSQVEIDEKVLFFREKYGIEIPIHCIYPGKIHQFKLS